MFRILPPTEQRRRPSEQAALEAWLGERRNVTDAALAATARPPPMTTVIHDVDAMMLQVFDIATGTDRHTDAAYLFDRAVERLRVMWMSNAPRPRLPQTAVAAPVVDSYVKKPFETRFLR